jgi:hypothetical protein
VPIILFVVVPWGVNNTFALLDPAPLPTAYEVATEAEGKLNTVVEIPELESVKPKLEGIVDEYSAAIDEAGLSEEPSIAPKFVDRWKNMPISKLDHLCELRWANCLGFCINGR